MLLRNISYRYKLPLCMILSSALTAVIAIMVVSWQYYSDSKHNLTVQSQELGNSMVDMLVWSLSHGDIWHAYTLLRGSEENSLTAPKRTYILIDEQQTIFASNQPKRFPTGAHVSNLKIGSSTFNDTLKNIVNTQHPKEISTDQNTLSSIPLLSDNLEIGTLIIVDSYESFSALFDKISLQGFLVILMIIAILAPLAWLWGKRIVNPLLSLESCILKIGKEPLENIQCLVPHDQDEIGRLSRHIQNMVNDLKEKSKLEHQVMKSDRLAAVGTLAAGGAHEINNPLAGMIMAVDTYKQYCTSLDCKQRDSAKASIDLVERGLAQIQETVAALLVNVNVNDKPLTRVDIEDTFKLVLPKSSTKSIIFNWTNDIHNTINIPSTFIRQILINLLLNAIHATHSDGQINCLIRLVDNSVIITIANNGDLITEQQLEHLFEPFYSTNKYGNGLGLWVTYQIIQNLDGAITVKSKHQWTTFEVIIPISIKELTK